MLTRNSQEIITKGQNSDTKQSILYQDNFAAQMVDLEILVEMNEFTVETLQKLMNFYSRAVDFFVQDQSSSYIYFKNKIKHLLLKPRVVELINNEEAKSDPKIASREEISKPSDTKPVSTSKSDQPQVKVLKSRPSLEYHMKMDNFQLNKELSTAHHTKHVEALVNTYASAHSQKEITIRSSLMEQKNNLRKRLEERKTNSRMSNQDKSALSMDKSRFDFPKRLTEFNAESRSQYFHGPRQTIPLRSNQRNLLSYDEYNIYQQNEFIPAKNESKDYINRVNLKHDEETP